MIWIIVLKSRNVGMHLKKFRMYDPQGIHGFGFEFCIIVPLGRTSSCFFAILCCVVFFSVDCLYVEAWGRS